MRKNWEKKIKRKKENEKCKGRKDWKKLRNLADDCQQVNGAWNQVFTFCFLIVFVLISITKGEQLYRVCRVKAGVFCISKGKLAEKRPIQ